MKSRDTKETKNKNKKNKVNNTKKEETVVSEVKNIPIVETIQRKYKNYSFSVKIDYKLGTVSIVDDYGIASNFKFVGRGIEYMAGWKEILENLTDLINFAEDKLFKYQSQVRKEREETMEKEMERAGKFLVEMFGASTNTAQ